MLFYMFLMPVYVLLPKTCLSNICGLRWVVMDWVNCVVNPYVRNESLHKVPGLSKSLAERLIWLVVRKVPSPARRMRNWPPMATL